MDSPENQLNQQQLESLISLAEADTDEGWAQVDLILPQICNDPSVLSWARDSTTNESSGLRDLSASILEASDTPLIQDDINKLELLMGDESYPGFRAACALAKRISQEEIVAIKDLIEEKLKLFVDDEDAGVSEIAREYLGTLSE